MYLNLPKDIHLNLSIVSKPPYRCSSLQIYVESKLQSDSCVKVRTGDRLGVYFSTPHGSVAYAFDPDEPAALLYESPDPAVPVNVSEEVDFTTLVFPYDFSMSAYIDTGMYKSLCILQVGYG